MTVFARSGTILIIVAALSALLASLAITFLARMRSDVEESRLIMQHAQAKLMLAAACNYVQEASRMGYDRFDQSNPARTMNKRGDMPNLPIHEEAFGWIDVRDGRTGPRDRMGMPFFPDPANPNEVVRDSWPGIGGHVRCPMHRMAIPPWAVQLTAAPNAMERNSASPDYFYPLLKNPDPLPVVPNMWSTETRAMVPHPMKAMSADERRGYYMAFSMGDKTPVMDSTGRAWFRLYRDGPATFIATCGAGATEGFKDWDEVTTRGNPEQFNNDPSLFNTLKASEIRLWYRLEWTAAVLETSYHNLHHEVARNHEHYLSWPPNSSHTWGGNSKRTQTWVKNPVGTIRWIQRLLHEPTNW